ncbi:MAG TPA: sulfotransferase domain-containing protein [Acidimicrobiales bacterium]|nr:sulfotransferase domain-containing protein [Acidimicrobiales bacterium]
MKHYRSPDEDSARWWDFEFRDGDVVVSTRSKSGTTWVQMICLLLVFGDPRLPGPLGELSPWLDWLVSPKEEVYALLDAQQHRRVIKTHTPLDGVPLDDRATYVVVARHPLDMAVSLYHHSANIDRARMAQLTGRAAPLPPDRARPALHEWLVGFIDRRVDPRGLGHLDTLPGAMLHLSDAWARRARPNVVLLHYDDLLADLEGTMRALASRLGVSVEHRRWPALVSAATLRSMRDSVPSVLPDTRGVLKDPSAFFRRGSSGEGTSILTAEELARYRARVAVLAPADLLAWLHRDDPGVIRLSDVPGPAGPDRLGAT